MRSLHFATRELQGSSVLRIIRPQLHLCSRSQFSWSWSSLLNILNLKPIEKSTKNSPLIWNNFNVDERICLRSTAFSYGNQVNLNITNKLLEEKLERKCLSFTLRKCYFEDGVQHCVKEKLDNFHKMVEEAEANNFSELLDSEERDFPKILATFHILCKIETMGRLLVDDNVENWGVFYMANQADKINNFTSEKNIFSYSACWESLLKYSQKRLVFELKKQLEEAEIKEDYFCKSLECVYCLLLDKYVYSYWEPVPYGTANIIDVLNDLPIKVDPKSFQSFRIFFNLTESPKWKI